MLVGQCLQIHVEASKVVGWHLQVNLKRERLELSPVYSTALVHDDHKLGYIRLTSFSQKAAADMRRHINKLEASSCLIPLSRCVLSAVAKLECGLSPS